MLLSLAEWLVLRGETMISNIAIEKAKVIVNSAGIEHVSI